ncbi:uncharacterized protein TRIREDRAFT_123396, partial [Trichoderma reesei QM6a]
RQHTHYSERPSNLTRLFHTTTFATQNPEPHLRFTTFLYNNNNNNNKSSSHKNHHHAFQGTKLVGPPLHPATPHQPRRRLSLPPLLQHGRRGARLPKVVPQLPGQHARALAARQPDRPREPCLVTFGAAGPDYHRAH